MEVKRSKGMAGEHIGSHAPYGYEKYVDQVVDVMKAQGLVVE